MGIASVNGVVLASLGAGCTGYVDDSTPPRETTASYITRAGTSPAFATTIGKEAQYHLVINLPAAEPDMARAALLAAFAFPDGGEVPILANRPETVRGVATTYPIQLNAKAVRVDPRPAALEVVVVASDGAWTSTTTTSQTHVLSGNALAQLNANFDTALSPYWVAGTAGAGMTTAWTQDTTTVYDAPGSLRGNVTASTAAVGAQSPVTHQSYIAVTAGTTYAVAAHVYLTNANLIGLPGVAYYDANRALLSTTYLAPYTGQTPSTWVRRRVAVAAPAGAVYARATFAAYDVTGGQTGSVYVDDAYLGAPTDAPADQGMLLVVPGQQVTYPTITITPINQRGAPLPYVGWKYQRQVTITNNGTVGLNRYPVRVNIGLGATWVADGKALASGDDVRVWSPDGRDLPRTLWNWNVGGSSSYVWFIIDRLEAGASATYDVMYGNSVAGAPATLATRVSGQTPNIPSFDLAISSNSTWSWSGDLTQNAANAGKGLWFINTGADTPAEVRFDAPGSWRRYLYLQNDDAFTSRRWVAYAVSGTTYWMGIPQLTRYRKDAKKLQDQGQNDSIAFYNPLGVSSVVANFKLTNIGGVGKFLILTRNSAGEAWATLYSDATTYGTQTTTTLLNLVPTTPARHICMVYVPQDEIVIPSQTNATTYCDMQFNTSLSLNISSGNLAVGTIGAETEVYDTNMTLRIDGGDASLASPPPAWKLLIGEATQGASAAHHLVIPFTQKMVIDCAARSAALYDTASGGLRRGVNYAVQATRSIVVAGARSDVVGSDWFPVRPTLNDLPNPTFAAGLTGWAEQNRTAGITYTATRDTSTGSITPFSSLNLTITANTGGAGGYINYLNSGAQGAVANGCVPIVGGTQVTVGYAGRVSDTRLTPRLTVEWYTASLGLISTVNDPVWRVPAPLTWYRRMPGFIAPTTAAYVRVIAHILTEFAGVTGTVWYDNFAVNGREVYAESVDDAGTMTITVAYPSKWL